MILIRTFITWKEELVIEEGSMIFVRVGEKRGRFHSSDGHG